MARMNIVTHDATAPRRTVSVTLNSDLMAKAKAATDQCLGRG
jgi:hypothetical protein